ncbi:prepilin peptidase [Cellulomonas sp. Sa3CUA2]|uniref:Prepilin leader peptidase/N-methyltransferase n=1 Tax=Cellulomonas avistercoris TaxID=2762242 RepID=A0ABR8Q8U2_9CELL|nr:A24 family peptidase [Cellulomonas avistercoris]MBD7916840.1 prepilin peptidase [Cellulomonas avistercoris]
MTGFVVAVCAAFGLVIGSFLNVVIWRVPRGESVVRPPSACPGCGAPVRPRDNVPVLSWILLRGRCRDCGEPISARYPVVEALTGLLFAATAWFFGPSWDLPAHLYLVAIGVALAYIDIDVHRLPDAITLPSYPVVLALLAVAAAGTGDWSSYLRAVVCGALLWAFYLLLVLVYPRGMGLGDVKLAGVLGMYLGWAGWGAFAVGTFGAFLVGGVFSLGLLATRRAGRKTGIPFGPWMLIGAALGIVVGEPLWRGYLDLTLGA